jgi:hypothetical protein
MANLSDIITPSGVATAAQGTKADGAAPLNSPDLTGVPLAQTAAPGTNTRQLATTNFVKTAVDASPFPSPTFTSTVTGSGTWDSDITTVAHGLGAFPSFVSGYLVCTVATLGFSVGDRISWVTGLGGSQGLGLSYDATNVYLTANNPIYFRRDTVSSLTISDANFNFVLEVWS